MDLRNISLRKLKREDAEAVSDIIRSNLLNLNSKEYPEEIIKQMYELYTSRYVFSVSNRIKMYVALNEDTVVGTASLDYDTIHTVFVDERHHGKGIEKKLLELLEEIVSNNGLRAVKLCTAVTAQKLYERLDYSVVEEIQTEQFGKQLIMQKYLI